MKDRQVAAGYQEVKNDPFIHAKYKLAYETIKRDGDIPYLGKVLCINDNFAMNSVLKDVLDCKQYDTVVIHGTHQKYCFNICKEKLAVDGFYTSLPDIHDYDTIVIDSACIEEEEYCELLDLVENDQNLITCYHGTLAFSPPDGNGNHIPQVTTELDRIRGQRSNDYIIGIDVGTGDKSSLVYGGLEDVKNGNLVDGPDVEADLAEIEEEDEQV